MLSGPVLAIPEDLAVHRIHGNNLYAGDYMAPSVEGVERLLVSSGTVKREIEQWIRTHGGGTGSTPTRRLLDRLVLPIVERKFAFEPPGRVHFFELLLRRNEAFGRARGCHLTTLKNVAAVVALVVGYRNLSRMHKWFGKTVSATSAVSDQHT